MKKHLTPTEEFEIMKLVLDKFLWLGFGVMVYGLWLLFARSNVQGLTYIGSGIVVLLLFIFLIVREYEFIKS